MSLAYPIISLEETLESKKKRSGLSKRELEIVALVARGLKNVEIAEKLFIEERTVKNHLGHIFKIFRVRGRLELALHAVYYELY